MAKIRHIAMQVPELEKAAAFYEGVFELKRVAKVESPIGNAISLGVRVQAKCGSDHAFPLQVLPPIEVYCRKFRMARCHDLP